MVPERPTELSSSPPKRDQEVGLKLIMMAMYQQPAQQNSTTFWTQKILEYHRTESVCSLSQILEAEVDEKYYLSAEKTQQLLTNL